MDNIVITVDFKPSEFRALTSCRLAYCSDIDIHELMEQVLVPMLVAIGYAKESIYDMCVAYAAENQYGEDVPSKELSEEEK
jgi:hypothetical protein